MPDTLLPPSVGIKHPDRLFIDGQWVKPSTDNMIDVVSPNTEETIIRIAEAREADIDRAVAAARKAFDEGPWPHLSHAERADKMRAIAQQLRARNDEFAYVWTEQMGALSSFTKTAGIDSAKTFEYFADMAATFPWEEERQPGFGGGVSMVVREPVGVVAAICPWNGPLGTMVRKVAPALLAGCTVVMKPSPETPLDAYMLMECMEAVGLPPGVVNLVTTQRDVADYLVCRPGIDKVAFTGSTIAGRRIATVCADRMARVTLELGGKSAAIILDDIDIADVVSTLTPGMCRLNGQVCASLTRVVVSKKRHDEFVDAFSSSMQGIRVGNSRADDTQLGPLAMKRQLDRVEGYIAKGKEQGAKLATGGGRPTGLNRGYFVEPTLFANVDNSMTIAQEEIFGPVVSVIPYNDVKDAMRIANDSIYGLNGAVFTNDVEAAYDVARGVRTGTFAQNAFKIDFAVPFGGFKQSGIGREGGPEGLLPYLELKTVHLPRVPRNLRG
ncbi:MAG TPA: aldehyde dehydrogenase [Alphaproteobacteria bacterium]|jgi:acyl-CoA reductase-like NAD-dependent aldehyde dehydrogenase|nr:aldehyde dehydrogenase [Alphaproteobacteria bacterium]